MNVHVKPTLPMLINGQLVASNKTFDVTNPSTGTTFTQCPDCTKEQFEDAVAAAKSAFTTWGKTSYEERKDLLEQLGARLTENADTLAELITLENGKPLAKAKQEIAASVFWLKGFAAIDFPVEVLKDNDTQRVELHRKPLGVVGQILPWNYPLMTAMFKLAPALIAGNTIVMKPSPYTPVTTLKLGEIVQDLFPAGVINVLSGGNELGAWISGHPDIRKVSFTGSTETGKKVMQSASSNMKRVTMELGGNDAGLVLDDIDPKMIANDLFWSRFSNNGQVCVAMKRLFVPEKLAEPIAKEIVEVAKNAKVGDGFDENSEIGPIQNKMQYEKVKAILDDAVSKGAKVIFQSEIPESDGYFFPITILTDVKPGMRIIDEEAFGPLMPILTYTDEEEALERVNDSEYGLGGSVWSSDVDRASALAGRIESGTAWVNQHPSMAPDVPYGGAKQSGIGVESGRWGVEEYTQMQVVSVKKS